MIRSYFAPLVVVLKLLAVSAPSANAAFHLWHVKEVFSNADGSVQFIELFDSFSSEQFVANHALRANSDGVIRNFVLPSNLPNTPSTASSHMLIATPGFTSLPGAVTPNFTLPAGPFFNPNANNITISFVDSNDSLTFSGSLLPKDGFNSLTDMNASGFPPGTTEHPGHREYADTFANVAGQIDLRQPAPVRPATTTATGPSMPPTMSSGAIRSNQSVSMGTGADGSGNGMVDDADYNFWRARFGSVRQDRQCVRRAGADDRGADCYFANRTARVLRSKKRRFG